MSNNDESIIRQLPHALGPEKAVLSVMMKYPAYLAEHSLDPEIFYFRAHRTLYAIMKNLPEVEPVSFVEAVRVAGELDNVGGASAIVDVFTYAPNNAHFENHLVILRDRHSRRAAISACNAAVAAAYDCDDDGAYLDALSAPITSVFDIAAAATPPKDMKALGRDFIEEFENKLSGKQLPMGHLTGIPEIDQALRGIHKQHMGIISARSGGGKSTLATQISANLATDGVGVLYLILERTEKSAFSRSVIQCAGVHHQAVSDPIEYARSNDQKTLDRLVLSNIRQGFTKLVGSSLHIRKPPNRRLGTQCAEIRRYVRLHGVQVVVLDQIGLVRGNRQKGDSEEVERRGVSNTLQELAHELNITIIVLSQITDDGDTKGARAIEEDADWHLQIVQERDRKKDNFGEHQHVLIAKDSHHGKTGERLPLVLDHATLRFVHGYPKTPPPKTTKKERY
jgi:replicative DNA helicase